MGMYRPPFDCIYAFESRVAAFTYGAAAVPFGVVTACHISTMFPFGRKRQCKGERDSGECTSLATKNPARLS